MNSNRSCLAVLPQLFSFMNTYDSFAWSVCLLLLLSSTLFACVLVCVTLYIHVGEEAVQFWHWFYAKPFDFLQTTNSELWILYIL